MPSDRYFVKFCPQCGTQNDLKHKFCYECGLSLLFKTDVINQDGTLLQKNGESSRKLAIAGFWIFCVFCAGLFLTTNFNKVEQWEYPPETTSSSGKSLSESPAISPSINNPSKQRSGAHSNRNRLHESNQYENKNVPLNSESQALRKTNKSPVQITVYITKTGERFHRENCRYLRYSAYPMTRSEAMASGYTPCRVCYP